MTVDQLVDRFIDLCIAEYNALELGEITKHNRLFRQMTAVEDELKSREGDARAALIPLYDHSNMQVRVMAAKATLAVAPTAARAALAAIKATQWHPQALNAGMCLWNLETGFFKPT